MDDVEPTEAGRLSRASQPSGRRPVPAWYRDPSGIARWRWWDGLSWTSDTSDDAHPPADDDDDVPEPESIPADSDVDPGSRDVADPVRPWRRRLLIVATVLCAVVGAALGGAVVGWRLADERSLGDAAGRPDAEFVEIRVPTLDGVSSDGFMPDVRGLSQQDALDVLADTVLAGDPPVIEERPWAGPEGIVIEQRPAFGTAAPPTVTLVVSTTATVPAVVGRIADDVIDELAALGTRVDVEQRMVDDVDPGTVVEVDPPEGAPLPETVRVVTAEPFGSVFLTELRPVDGACRSGRTRVDGRTYEHALTCTARSRQAGEVGWLLDRGVERIEGAVGLPDDGPDDIEVRVVLLLDGVPVIDEVVGYGQTVALDADTSGALRLTLQASVVTEETTRSSAGVVLADLRLIGAPDLLDQLR